MKPAHTLGGFTPAEYRVFDALCSRVSGQSGPGLTSAELADCGALARQLCGDEPEMPLIETLLERLELEAEDLETLEGGDAS